MSDNQQPSENSTLDEDQKIVAEARKFFDLVAEAETDYRHEAIEDLKFFTGDQWPDDIKTARQSDGRPCLTINRLPQLSRQVTNDQRQNRPSIKTYPFDSKADVQTAEVIQGLIKNIEYNSNADYAYDIACKYQVECGRGFLRVLTDYADPMSFDQDIKIGLIDNPMSVYFDHFSVEPDGSDATKCLITDEISKESYREQYPNSQMSAMTDWKAVGDNNIGWVSEHSCRIAEFFKKDYKRKKILLLSSGDVILASQYKEGMNLGQDEKGQPIVVKSERESMIPVIMWYKINGVEVLDKKEWPGAWIPVVPVYGEKTNVDGRIIIEGIIRNAKDAQRMYNYWTSAETETIALAPRAPWIMAVGQDEGNETEWRDSNRRNFAVLKYTPVSVEGTVMGPPKRNMEEPPVQAITQAKAFSADDMKATTGVYDAGLGAQSSETSGIAIQRRNNQIQTSNFHYVDNFTRSLKHTGRIVLDLIPVIYDTERTIRIMKDDGTADMVAINQVFQNKHGGAQRHDLSIGKYDVAVETGPSYATKRMEAAASLEKVLRAYPQLMQIAGDILVQNMDWPGARELSERIKKTIPPNLLEDSKDNPVPPQAQAQMAQMGQMIQQLSEKSHELAQIIENKKLELASKERIEMAKLQMAAEQTLFKSGVASAEYSLEHQVEMLDRKQAMLMAQQPLNNDQNQAAGGAPAAQPGQQQNMPTGGLPPG